MPGKKLKKPVVREDLERIEARTVRLDYADGKLIRASATLAECGETEVLATKSVGLDIQGLAAATKKKLESVADPFVDQHMKDSGYE